MSIQTTHNGKHRAENDKTPPATSSGNGTSSSRKFNGSSPSCSRGEGTDRTQKERLGQQAGRARSSEQTLLRRRGMAASAKGSAHLAVLVRFKFESSQTSDGSLGIQSVKLDPGATNLPHHAQARDQRPRRFARPHAVRRHLSVWRHRSLACTHLNQHNYGRFDRLMQQLSRWPRSSCTCVARQHALGSAYAAFCGTRRNSGVRLSEGRGGMQRAPAPAVRMAHAAT